MSGQLIDTLFLLGTGAQENSWAPVIKAIANVQMSGLGDPAKVTCPESATSFFASLVNYRRHLIRIRWWSRLAWRTRKMKRVLAEAHRALKARIAAELRQAVGAGTIRLRPQFLQMVAEYWGKGSVAFLTTNWDPLLENWLRTVSEEEPRLVYLHGDIADPDLMLLPGEIVAEWYRRAADRNRMEQQLFRNWNVIEQSRRIVIYGHSISAIEAELRVMLSMGFSNVTPGEIVIVSLRRDAQPVRQRVLPLIPPKRPWKVDIQPVD